MEVITLNSILKQGDTVYYDFAYTSGLKKYFTGKPFTINYAENIELVPDAILAVPFVGSIIPIVWLTHCELRLNSLDKAFYECLPNLKKGYETMFPESKFEGNIKVRELTDSVEMLTPHCAMFYSGGVDSMYTFINHLDERPDLLSIWGSDIKYENETGWKLVHQAIEEAAEKCGLPEVFFHSTFREFDDEGVLHAEFSSRLKDGWWHGVKHGIALLSHVAPYAYLHHITKMYIASSHCPEDGLVRCASNPLTDNQVKFVNCQVVHDGFENSRQKKIKKIIDFNLKEELYLPLHVCWESQSGGNCCHCEKCYRTIVGILIENGDPSKYGFSNWKKELVEMRKNMVENKNHYIETYSSYWTHISERIREQSNNLKYKTYWKDIKWIGKTDFKNIDSIKLDLKYRIYRKLSQII